MILFIYQTSEMDGTKCLYNDTRDWRVFDDMLLSTLRKCGGLLDPLSVIYDTLMLRA